MIRSVYVIMTSWRNPRHLAIVWNTEKNSVRYTYIDHPEITTPEEAKLFLETAVDNKTYNSWKTNSVKWMLKHTETNDILAEIEREGK